MEFDLDNISLDPTSAWSEEFKDWYQFIKLLTARIQANGKDITGNLGKDWYRIGCVYAIYGEQGRQLFHDVTALCDKYDKNATDEKYTHCLATSKTKTWKALKDICIYYKIDIKDTRQRPDADVGFFLTSQGFDEDAIIDARLYQLCDKDCCTYSIKENRTDSGILVSVTPTNIANFILNIRYLVKDKNNPLRIVDFKYKNNMGRITEETFAMPTDAMISINSFKKFIEGRAGLVFKGTDFDLIKIKQRFYPFERQAIQINVLGYYEYSENEKIQHEIYFLNNGAICNYEFYETDKYGFIEIEDLVFYLPSANRTNWIRKEDYEAQRNFIYKQSDITFEQWSALFYKVYGKPGMVGMLFAICCMFSDIIFRYMDGFPMPYLYGPPSGGKGSLIKSLQYLWGNPQKPIPIPSRKSTDKAKVRRLAQFSNALMLGDEYPEYPSSDLEEGTKLLYDRMGDSRADFDQTFNTNEVPISSGIMLTSNYRLKNHALITRVINIDILETERTKIATDNYNLLKEIQRDGISNISANMLNYRSHFKHGFIKNFKELFTPTSAELKKRGVKEDRPQKNVTMLLAAYKTLEQYIRFPFEADELKAYAIESMAQQNNRIKTEDKVSVWWTIFLKNIKDQKIKHGFHYDINSDKLAIVWMPCYTEYMNIFSTIHKKQPPPRLEMRELLDSTEEYIKEEPSYRFKNSLITGTSSIIKQTSVKLFDLNKLQADGYDIIYYTQNVTDESETYNKKVGVDIDTLNNYETNLNRHERN